MTVQTSSIAAAWDYLVDAARAAFPDTVAVFDGPMPVVDDEDYLDRVAIGWDGAEESFEDAVTGSQAFRNLDRGINKDELYEIVCSVTHWDGDNNVRTARAKAFALLATFEKLMRGYPPNGSGDVSLGGAVLFAGIGGAISVIPILNDSGASVTVVFHVACTARLTGA